MRKAKGRRGSKPLAIQQLVVCRSDEDDALFALAEDGVAYEYVERDKEYVWRPLTALVPENIIGHADDEDEEEDEEDAE